MKLVLCGILFFSDARQMPMVPWLALISFMKSLWFFIIKKIFRLHRQRAHVSLLADPHGPQVSGALPFSWNAIKTPLLEEKIG
jgi:hypothetical protein